MNDVNTPLREAYISALTPLLAGVPIYDQEAPASAPRNYVLLMDINGGEIMVKGGFYNNVSLTLNIVTRFDLPKRGNFKTADGIAGVIMKAILADKALDLKPAFFVTGSRKDRDNNITYKDKTTNFYTRVLSFRSRIKQLN